MMDQRIAIAAICTAATRHALLHTEMVTTGALIHQWRRRHLRFNAEEHPLALQLGGSASRSGVLRQVG
jgi:tRNA-dihydrouridine synthase